jgi:hypothetical protein
MQSLIIFSNAIPIAKTKVYRGYGTSLRSQCLLFFQRDIFLMKLTTTVIIQELIKLKVKSGCRILQVVNIVFEIEF